MPEFDIDEAAIRHLAELMAQSGLAEIELAEGERRLRVVRAATGEARALAPEDGAAARRRSPT